MIRAVFAARSADLRERPNEGKRGQGACLDFVFVNPELPSFRRWRAIYRGHGPISCLRALEYEQLARLDLKGQILDLGGGEKSLYRKQLPAGIAYQSVNIDPDIEPTFLVEPDERLPISDDTYDACICLNTLEHVYDARFLLGEMLRVLKPGGTAYITVPFIFRVHGHPDDYFRGTPSWWRESLKRAGFSRAELLPLIWGRRTTADSIRGTGGLLPGARRGLAHLADIGYGKLMFSSSGGRYAGRRGERICDVALGYFISARK